MQAEYDAFMQEYVNLPLETKREEIIIKLRKLISTMHKLILDMRKEEVSESDFLEGTFGYTNAL